MILCKSQETQIDEEKHTESENDSRKMYVTDCSDEESIKKLLHNEQRRCR